MGARDKRPFYLKDIAVLIEKFMKKVQVSPSNVLFYGSSGGGFMSMFLAGYVKGAKALVNNPQTCLTKWLKTPVRQVFNLSYPNLTEDEVIASYGERINVVKFFAILTMCQRCITCKMGRLNTI